MSMFQVTWNWPKYCHLHFQVRIAPFSFHLDVLILFWLALQSLPRCHQMNRFQNYSSRTLFSKLKINKTKRCVNVCAHCPLNESSTQIVTFKHCDASQNSPHLSNSPRFDMCQYYLPAIQCIRMFTRHWNTQNNIMKEQMWWLLRLVSPSKIQLWFFFTLIGPVKYWILKLGVINESKFSLTPTQWDWFHLYLICFCSLLSSV